MKMGFSWKNDEKWRTRRKRLRVQTCHSCRPPDLELVVSAILNKQHYNIRVRGSVFSIISLCRNSHLHDLEDFLVDPIFQIRHPVDAFQKELRRSHIWSKLFCTGSGILALILWHWGVAASSHSRNNSRARDGQLGWINGAKLLEQVAGSPSRIIY